MLSSSILFSDVKNWKIPPKSFTEMMTKIIEKNSGESPSKLLKLGPEIWKKFSNTNQIEMKLDCKTCTKTWICEISDYNLTITQKENDIVKKKEIKNFIEKEQCKCYLEKQIKIKKKKDFKNIN